MTLGLSSNPHVFDGARQRIWNSTSLNALKECPKKYELSILRGWTSLGENIHIIFGLAYHKAVELFHFAKAEGKDYNQALLVAVRYAMLSVSEAQLPPQASENKKTRTNLVRSIIWYLEEFGEEDPIETLILPSGEPAVEVTFQHDLSILQPDGTPYILSGHIDRIGRFAGRLHFTDLKTTGAALGEYYFKHYSPNNQMSLYAYAGKVIHHEPIVGGILDVAQVMVGFTRYQRGFVHRTPGQLAEWEDDLSVWISLAESYALARRWPQNDQACRMCQFQPICAKDPSVRESFLKTNFSVRTINPLEIRT